MPTRPRKTLPILLLALVALVGACATGGAAGEDDRDTSVIVENDLIPATSLTIYAVTEYGARTLVGTVSPGQTKTLRFRASAATPEYRFVAQTTAGGELASNPLTFSRGATLRWNLRSNIATVEEPGG